MMDISPQFRNLVSEQGPSTPVEGTAKHPEGRLFAPTGMHQGDPWAMAPERWVKGEAATGAGDTMAWHSSESAQLPRHDDPTASNRPIQETEDEESGEIYQDEDEQGRPLMRYGSGVGMHFGSQRAALERDFDRPFMHPVRIPGSTIEPASRTSEGRGKNWTDEKANYSGRATSLVEQGKALPYSNVWEHTGSTSYRAMPSTARTWSEDVQDSAQATRSRFWGEGALPDPATARNRPHPALEHVAKLGYEPTVASADIRKGLFNQGDRQMTLPGFETPYSADVYREREQKWKDRIQLPELTMMGPNEADTWHDRNPSSDG